MCDVRRKYSVHDCFLLEECLGYGLVVPFPAYGFAALVSHNESLNSLNSGDYTSGGFSADEQEIRATASEIWSMGEGHRDGSIGEGRRGLASAALD